MANTTGKKHGGRAKGTPNRKSFKINQILAEMKYDPLRELILSLQKEAPTIQDVETLRRDMKEGGMSSKEIDQMVETMKDCLTRSEKANILLKFLDYIYPKRKAVDSSGDSADHVITETLEQHLKRIAKEG